MDYYIDIYFFLRSLFCIVMYFTVYHTVGDPVSQYQKKDGRWQKLEMHINNSFQPQSGKSQDISDVVNFYYATGKDSKLESDKMFDLLYNYSSKGYILAAGTDGKIVTEAVQEQVGLVSGHAYTILGVYKPKLTTSSGVKLLKLRNPW